MTANPLPPSRNSPFITNFEFVGTLDGSPYLCLPAAIEWRKNALGGEERIRDYCFTLAREGGRKVAEMLGTEVLENDEGTLGRCCFANIRLPLKMDSVAHVAGVEALDRIGKMSAVIKVRDWICDVSNKDYSTFFALVVYNGAFWVRLSAQVYLEMADFEWSAQVLKEICERVMRGDFLETDEKSKL
jgi:hercynylcysteine S-oxide lyase